MGLTVLLDFVMVILLALMIVHAINLNKKLTLMRTHYDEFKDLSNKFSASLGAAEQGVDQLQMSAAATALSLKEYIEKAHQLREDLQFIYDRADGLANQLEDKIRAGRVYLYTQPDLNKQNVSAPSPAAVVEKNEQAEVNVLVLPVEEHKETIEKEIPLSNTFVKEKEETEEVITAHTPEQEDLLKILGAMR